jgi:hypothetical protein
MCSKPIMNHQTKVYAVRGYEETRSGGGQNHVLEKERIDGYVWHRHCWDIAIARRKGTGKQLTL